MRTFIEKQLSSPYLTVGLMAVLALGMALATILEKYTSTEMAKIFVYYNPAFFIIQLLLIANFIAALVSRQMFKNRKWGGILVHFAFILIVFGALITHFIGQEGVLHLREGETDNRITIQSSKGIRYAELPFSVELSKFNLVRYPGSSSPSSYESEVVIHIDGKTYPKRIFMNNVLDLKGYRFFQSSYDTDEKGTILSVSKDVTGRIITYTGYALLALGFLLFFMDKNSRFQRLRRMLKDTKSLTLPAVAFLLLISIPAEGAKDKGMMNDVLQQYVIPKQHAAHFGALPMQSYNGRIKPVNTFSSEILRKIHKSDKIGKLNSDQFLLSLLAMPDMWMSTPIIIIGNRNIASRYGFKENQCAFIDIFDSNGNYILEKDVDLAYNKMPSARNRFDKDLIKLDEQINILYRLFQRQMLNIFPLKDDTNHRWYAEGDDLSAFTTTDSAFISESFATYIKDIQTGLEDGNFQKADESLQKIADFQSSHSTFGIDSKRISTELRYNSLNPFRLCKIFYLSIGGILLILGFVSMVNERKWMKWTVRILAICVLVVFHFHMMGMGMRWIIGGYAPWSNSYETMVYVAWASVFGGIIFSRKSTVAFAIAVLFGGIILFVSGLNWMDPQINLLVPVLKSPWLMFHVAVIVAAYGFFGISCLLGINNLIMLLSGKKLQIPASKVYELTLINEMSLWIGLALMTVGTFLGAIWANESWGRYWGWDPKETWALITIIVYSTVLHMRFIKKYDNMRLLNIMSILAFTSVLMTYFGVNYFLSGMHSYGG